MTPQEPSTSSALTRALAAAAYDFNRIDPSGVVLDRPSRRGIRVVVARTTQLPDDALDAILAWRLAQYLLTGFLDEPVVGVAVTAGAFAVKHPLVDGRWRRAVGLAMFWTGLALVRRRSPAGALTAHVAANTGAVVLGHAPRATGSDVDARHCVGLTGELEGEPMTQRKQPAAGFVVLQHVGGDRWRMLGEVPRRRGMAARAARSQAVLGATDGKAKPGEVYAAVLRSEWRVALDWTFPSEG